MSEIKYISLLELIENNRENIKEIKGQYLLLLSELTIADDIETEIFVKNIKKIFKMGTIIVAYFIEENGDIKIIASGTIIIEPKIIRYGKNVGHIEDIVVVRNMRGKGVSAKIISNLKKIAKELNCYKVILDCSEKLKNFYKKNNFMVNGVQMCEYF